jgi:hypothetical protein
MSARYTRLLDRPLGIFMHVEFKTDRREVVDYSIVCWLLWRGDENGTSVRRCSR